MDALTNFINFSGGFKVSQIIIFMVIAGVICYLGYLLKEVLVVLIRGQKIGRQNNEDYMRKK